MQSSERLQSFKSLFIASTLGSHVEPFPCTTKRKRQADLLVLEPHSVESNSELTDLFLYRNPYVLGFPCPGGWEKLKVATLRNPTALAYGDISLNGQNDVIVADECEVSMPDTKSFCGRVSWFENTGTGVNDWVQREIGKLRGTHTIRVGRFTNNYSLQVMAVPLTGSTDSHGAMESTSPLVIYTQPPNIVSEDSWLSSRAFPKPFHVVSDVCLVHPPARASGTLDKVLLASKEGITLVWWEMEKWHVRNIVVGMTRSVSPFVSVGLVNVAKVGNDGVAYIVSAGGPIVSVCTRRQSTAGVELQHAQWSIFLLDDFSKRGGAIVQVRCVDLDSDGVEGVLVLVKSHDATTLPEISGLWYYKPIDFASGIFKKSKVIEGDISRVAAGNFQSQANPDIVTISSHIPHHSSHEGILTLHSRAKSQSDIHVSLSRQGVVPKLLLGVPNPIAATATHELPLFLSFNVTFSLVVLPPCEFFLLSHGTPEVRDGVKVLDGRVSWTNLSGEKVNVERAMAESFCHDGSMGRPMSVDSRSGGLTAGTRGAVFLRMKVDDPEKKRDGLDVQNLIPTRYSAHVGELKLEWQNQAGAVGCAHTQVFTLDAFRVQIEDEKVIANVHLTAVLHSSTSQSDESLPMLIPTIPPAFDDLDTQSQLLMSRVRACIVNGSGKGGVYAELSCSHRSRMRNIFFRRPRRSAAPARAALVPSLTEVAPMWCTDGKGKCTVGNVLYPGVHGWLTDVTSFQNESNRCDTRRDLSSSPRGIDISKSKEGNNSYDVWMDVDFPPFNLDSRGASFLWRRSWFQLLVGCLLTTVLVWVHHHLASL